MRRLIHRLWPRSLAAQMLVVLGLALLAAQIVNFALVLNERQKLSLAQNEAPAIARYAQVASDLTTAAPDLRGALLTDMSRRGARYALQADSAVPEAARDPSVEKRLLAAMSGHNAAAAELRAGYAAQPERRADRDRPPGPPPRWLTLATRQADGQWLVGRLSVPPRDEWLVARIAAATLLVYAIVLGVSAWAALRLARPLRDLTRAADAFRGRDAPTDVTPSGPEDLRHAIEAFNAMNQRVLALLDEKDRMLGALGHDLRTPLASLRIRIESMEPEDEREAAIAKIAEMTDMVEEILVLARSGRAREPAKRMDVSALVETLVDDQQELGRDVTMTPHARVVVDLQPGLLRRALANLIDNAVKYAGHARVSLVEVPGGVDVRVEDGGPGIPDAEMALALEPFYRRETSRNRATGGAGLGLAIARNVAESHGGALRLERADAEQGGLAAVLFLPVGGAG